MLYFKNLDHFLDQEVEPVINSKEYPSIAFGVIITEIDGVHSVRCLGNEAMIMFIPDEVIRNANTFKEYYICDMRYGRAREKDLKPYPYEANLPMSRGEKLKYGLFIQYNSNTDHWYPNVIGDSAAVKNIPSECFVEAQLKFEEYIPKNFQ